MRKAWGLIAGAWADLCEVQGKPIAHVCQSLERQGIWTKRQAHRDSLKFFPNCLYFFRETGRNRMYRGEPYDITVYFTLQLLPPATVTSVDHGYSQIVG